MACLYSTNTWQNWLHGHEFAVNWRHTDLNQKDKWKKFDHEHHNLKVLN